MGRRLMSACVALAMVLWSLPLGSTPAAAASTSVVISQVYGGGGNSGAFYKNDFIELYNRGTTTVDLGAWSVQYGSATGVSWTGKTNLVGSIAPGRYYLVQELAGAGGTASLPTPDATGTIAMAAGAARVALVNNQTGLTGSGCSAPGVISSPSVVDLVGYGTGTSGANCFEGAAPAPTLTNLTAALRVAGGADTDQNGNDFAAGNPGPRNAAITDAAPYVGSFAPTANMTGVARNANVVLNVSEPVNVAGVWYAISCVVSGSHTGAVAVTATQLMIDPTTDFVFSETCTVAIDASLVTDIDANDPPDSLVSGVSWSFTIAGPPVAGTVRIHDIQGAIHISPLRGASVTNVPGIVTGLQPNGFYLQDPTPDTNDSTSEGVFVFTSSTPAVAVGDSVVVSAAVTEFRPGGSSSSNLTTTELSGPSVVVITSGNPLPAAVRIGIDRMPPTEVIEDDATTGDVETGNTFDPASDGLDFWESMEGMRVDLGPSVSVVGPSNSFGEISVLANDGAGATGRTARGGIKIGATDKNPERVIIKGVDFAMPSDLNVGDQLNGPIVGVVDYNFGNFMVQVFTPPTKVAGGLVKETTSAPGTSELTIATFNVQNLDVGDGQAKFDGLADLIVGHLLSPDVISLEEVQDNNGALNDGTVAANVTLQALHDAVVAKGGPSYAWREIDPVDQQDGGEPGGNIRQVFFYRVDRGVSFIDRPGAGSTTPNNVVAGASGPQLQFSPGRIMPTDSAFSTSRKPLAAEFTYRGHHVFAIANHWNSKGGDDALWGRDQPPVLNSEVQRVKQATIVRDFVKSILTLDPNAEIVVLGDLNDFEWSNPLTILKGAPMNDLNETLPVNERYTYVFEGNSQTLDHILVSDGLLPTTRTDIVHVNAEFWDGSSDHDPQVAFLHLVDSSVPSITAPADIHTATGPFASSCATIVSDASLGVATATDNAGPPVITRSGVPAGNIFPIGTTTITYTATDSTGNTATATQTVTVVDNTPPTISAPADASYQLVSLVPAAGAAQATASDNCGAVTVTFVETSNGGAGSPASPLVITRTYTATDAAGNQTSASQTITVIDSAAPTISGAPTTLPNANHWWNTPVTIHFTCADNSGLVTCPADISLTADGADQSVTATATDAAGNTATATVGDIDIDRTAPTITFTGATAYTVDQTVSITCASADATSGLDLTRPNTCPVASGHAYSFGLGAHTLSATATDRAGNVATRSITFRVRVDAASLCAVTKQLVTKASVGRDLCDTLLGNGDDDQGDRDREGGQINSGRNDGRGNNGNNNDNDGKKASKRIAAFIKEVDKQRGKALTNANADLLILLARAL